MTAMQPVAPLTIDIISDVVCPWCFVGKRKLEAALALKADVPVALRWRPYQLDPTIPAGGLNRRAYYEKKFGGPRQVGQIYDRLRGAAEGLDINFAFEAMERAPNTLDAHRLIRWAASADAQNDVVERLFKAFFEEGADIGDPEVLIAIAVASGMDAGIVRGLLAGGDDIAAVQAEIAQAQQLGVTGVPFFIIGGRYAVSGAQSPEVLVQTIERALVPGGETLVG